MKLLRFYRMYRRSGYGPLAAWKIARSKCCA